MRFLPSFAAATLLAIPLTLFSAVESASAATVIHVDPSAAGFANGSSWVDAYTDLQSALAAATSGDEIRVAAGSYRPAVTDRTVSFSPPSGVTIIGGYATGGSTESDPSAHRTTLTGDLIGDDLPGFVNTGDNSHHVVDVSGTSNVVLQGVAIQGGNADAAATTAGGGILNVGSTGFVLDAVTVSLNSAVSGGGMANQSSSPVILNSHFHSNTATQGGGIHNLDGDPAVVATRITNNVASSGGGVYNDNADTTAVNSVVAFNSGNVGGGIHNDGSATSWSNTVVSGNSGASGAGFYSVFATTTIVNSVLWNNNGTEIENAFGGSTVATFSVVDGGWPGTGNLASDPLFVGPADFRFQPDSPARDVADNSSVPADVHDVDGDGDTTELTPAIDGAARINGTTADLGAFETAVPFDAFATAGALTGSSGSVSVSTVGATEEPNEPTPACGAGAAPVQSVWLSYTAASTGPVQFDTLGSTFDTVLQVHTGSALGSLTTIDCNDDVAAAATTDSALVVDVAAGETYRLQIDGSGAATGTATVTWGPAATLTPSVVAATEGNSGTSLWQLPVTLSGPSTIPIVVDWDILDVAAQAGFATTGVDLLDGSGTLTFAPGVTANTISVEVIGDLDAEQPLLYGEWALVNFQNPVNTRVTGGFFGAGIVVIIDDD